MERTRYALLAKLDRTRLLFWDELGQEAFDRLREEDDEVWLERLLGEDDEVPF